jgi:hypothetical protein
MLRSIKELNGYTITALDDEPVGTVHDFYFDDHQWVIRYLVVDTGTWLPGRKVLISPVSLGRPDWNGHHSFPVNLTKEQIKNSPDIDTDKPIERQQEAHLIDYYQWPAYWAGPSTWGMGMQPFIAYGGIVRPSDPTGAVNTPGPITSDQEAVLEKAYTQERTGDPHLRSADEVINYYIEASDGDVGHVEDFLVDDQSWTIRYMVVDTRNWLPGKKVLVAIQWIKEITWAESRVYVDLSRARIKNSPEYDPAAPLNRAYEAELHDHYDRPKYWGEE